MGEREKIKKAVTRIFESRMAFMGKNEQEWINEITDEVAEALEIKED